MSILKSVARVLLLFSFPAYLAAVLPFAPLSAQHIYPKKELVFTQVIAGPGFTSTITLSNRGTEPFSGALFLSVGGESAPWNPMVNFTPVINGTVQVDIQPDETRVFHIQDSTFTVGLVFIGSYDFFLDNHVEGNLTYYSYSGSLTFDAVGVPASSEFFNAVLPFNHFEDIGLSLGNFSPDHASVDVTLFDVNGTRISTCRFTVLSGGHFAMYLKELPWETAVGVFGPYGKVEIETDVSLSGIAMTVTPDGSGGAQISTLPISGSPLQYTLGMTSDSSQDIYMARLELWIEGYFVKGYMTLTQVNGEFVDHGPFGSVPFMVTGRLKDNSLDLAFVTDSWPTAGQGFGVSLYLHISGFSPQTDEMYGDWRADHIFNPETGVLTGEAIINNMKIE